MTADFPYSDTDLARFRDVQRLAYDCAARVAGWLAPGVTERQAAARLRGELMPFILDCAPVADGYTADIGYAGRLGDNRAWDRIAQDLGDYRSLILREVRAREPLADIYTSVDALIARHGYDNRHRLYPGRLIGHQVTRLRPARRPGRAPSVTVAGFGVRSLQTIGRELITERARGRSPLWAVEPHVALRGVGLKFEELLVVTPDDAYWLDDDLPHVRRWAA